jgi:hypothetical protein
LFILVRFGQKSLRTGKHLLILALLILNTWMAGAQQNDFSDYMSARDSSMWFEIENLNYQARELEYRRDSILMVRQEIEEGEGFPGRADTLRSLLRRALQYHLDAIARQENSHELLGLIYRNQLQELETVRFWYVGDKKVMRAQRLYTQGRSLQEKADSIREQVDQRLMDPGEQAQQLDYALRQEDRGLRKMNQAWQLYHSVTGGVKNVLKASLEPQPVIGELKKITDEALAVVSQSREEVMQEKAKPIPANIGAPPTDTSPGSYSSDENEAILPVKKSDLVFRVQIAASQKPFSPLSLDSIYSGMKDILLIRDNGWYRYTIGQCPTYHHADSLRKYVNIDDAFVVAYQDDRRLDASNYANGPEKWPAVELIEGLPADTGVVYRVQIAASPTPLDKNGLQFIYCNSLPVYVSWKKPFYRYMIGSYRSYKKASELQRSLCTPGAFVVAHRNGQRINIREALSITGQP